MARFCLPILLLFLQGSSFFPSILPATAHRVLPPRSHRKQLGFGPSPAIRAGYWPSWTNATFPPSSIQPYFTHVFYAFVQPDPNTFELVVAPSDAAMLADFSAAIHSSRPPMKAMLSIGGGGSPPATFAAIAAGGSAQSAFINSSIAVAREYGLDGLDLDWEFPKDPQEMANLGEFLVAWRHAVEKEAAATSRPWLLLTSAVYFASRFFLPGNTPRSYPAAGISAGLDWVNVMSYDYHGSWDTSETGEHAAWYDPTSNISTSYGLASWIAAGVPRGKLVMGLPLYGRTWQLKDPAEHGIGAPAVAVGPGDDGVMLYKDVVDYNLKNNATEVFNRTFVAAYSYAGVNWIGYDSPASAAMKAQFAQELGIGGYFFWAIGYDKDWSITKAVWWTWMH